MSATERFLDYISYETKSAEDIAEIPSTKSQFALANRLAEDMKKLGMTGVRVDANCYAYGFIEANADIPGSIGFIAHVDTSPEMSDENVKAKIVEYRGGDIVLNEQAGIVMTEKDFPRLARHIGEHLIVTDGTTLLGADDKAGVAEIMDACEKLIASGEPHGRIAVAFTPDEEVGHGADMFDVESFACDYAYTIDGGEIGEIEYENFNAASAYITINGRSIHPGLAKDAMINALNLVTEFNTLLPAAERPEHTENYEGFFHLNGIEGGVERASMKYIIRDHDMTKFLARKKLMADTAAFMNARYGEGRVECRIVDTYYNMVDKITPHMEIIEKLEAAMIANGVTPKRIPIRGGTDGARLSFMGLPCPNVCTGGDNFHGKYEFVPTEALEKISDIIFTMMKGQ